MIMVCSVPAAGVDLVWEGVLIGRPGVRLSWVLGVVDGQRLGCRSDDEGSSDLGEPVERGGELGGPRPAWCRF